MAGLVTVPPIKKQLMLKNRRRGLAVSWGRVEPVILEENILDCPGVKGKPKSIDDAPNAEGGDQSSSKEWCFECKPT